MSDLRQQLDGLKRDYSAARYPGDLAADVLPATRRLRPMVIGAWMAGAIAASIVIVAWVGHETNIAPTGYVKLVTTSPVDISTTQPTAEDANIVDSLGGATDVSLVPTQPDISIPSMPSIPSMEAMVQEQQLQDQSTSTTKESV